MILSLPDFSPPSSCSLPPQKFPHDYSPCWTMSPQPHQKKNVEFSPWYPSPASRLKHSVFVVAMGPGLRDSGQGRSGLCSTVLHILPLRLCPSPPVSHVKFSLLPIHSQMLGLGFHRLSPSPAASCSLIK